ncbi:hypothetical protein [Cystobacter ferrugineus]|uniref:hypothetical protein n=1 Tax=Cystobacter ferrugineus TaxID=83449 RepID=UPI0011610B41|nr:hypothetical protein [Cystobacter ferrugineus]
MRTGRKRIQTSIWTMSAMMAHSSASLRSRYLVKMAAWQEVLVPLVEQRLGAQRGTSSRVRAAAIGERTRALSGWPLMSSRAASGSRGRPEGRVRPSGPGGAPR